MTASCKTCPLWRSRVRPERGESPEYLAHRPCGDGLRTNLRGSQVMSVSGTRLLTGPDAVCDRYAGRGGER